MRSPESTSCQWTDNVEYTMCQWTMSRETVARSRLNPAQNWTTCTQGHTWHWDCQNLSIFAESVWQHAYVKDHALQVSATLFSSAHSSWLHSHAFMNTHTHTLTCKRSTLNSSVPWIWHRTEPRALNVTRGTGIASLHKSLQCQFGSMPMRGSMRFRSLQIHGTMAMSLCGLELLVFVTDSIPWNFPWRPWRMLRACESTCRIDVYIYMAWMFPNMILLGSLL